jgi:hypothetical protein
MFRHHDGDKNNKIHQAHPKIPLISIGRKDAFL